MKSWWQPLWESYSLLMSVVHLPWKSWQRSGAFLTQEVCYNSKGRKLIKVITKKNRKSKTFSYNQKSCKHTLEKPVGSSWKTWKTWNLQWSDGSHGPRTAPCWHQVGSEAGPAGSKHDCWVEVPHVLPELCGWHGLGLGEWEKEDTNVPQNGPTLHTQTALYVEEPGKGTGCTDVQLIMKL